MNIFNVFKTPKTKQRTKKLKILSRLLLKNFSPKQTGTTEICTETTPLTPGTGKMSIKIDNLKKKY